MEREGVKKKRFDKALKIQTVKMVTEEGQKASEAARSLGIPANALYSWKRKFADEGDKAFVGKGHLTELSALRKELREVRMERDILKKAARLAAKRVGIFSKTTGNGSDL